MKRGGPLQRKTPLRSSKPMARGAGPKRKSKPRPKRSPNEFPEETKIAVMRRSGGKCEVRSRVCTGRAQHFHHRKLKRHGDQSPENCLHLCPVDHITVVHLNVDWSLRHGLLVRSDMNPALVSAVTNCDLSCEMDHIGLTVMGYDPIHAETSSTHPS